MRTYYSSRGLASAVRVDRGQISRLTARRIITPAAQLAAGSAGRQPTLLFPPAALDIVRAHLESVSTRPQILAQ